MRIGTPLSATATRALLLGSGELGKEVVIELQRLGVETIAVDRYANAPAMQVAHRSHVLDMLDGRELRRVIEAEKPHLVIPEIEAIATAELVALEAEGWRIVPTARAVALTMNREGIRRLAAETLGVPTSPYRFAATEAECRAAVAAVGLPCLVKPVMSSSGKGQSTVRAEADVPAAWGRALSGGARGAGPSQERALSGGARGAGPSQERALSGGARGAGPSQDARGGAARVIVEGFVRFDYEVTLLTVRAGDEVTFCAPIGHRQEGGDYRESWQPQPMAPEALAECDRIAALVTGELGGSGLFGVEFFVQEKPEVCVWFSEASPRPHDTGLVTLASQQPSEFALHVRAVLGLPVPAVRQLGPSASAVITVRGQSDEVAFDNLAPALAAPDTTLRLFGKPEVRGERRMGVALARAASLAEARAKARRAAAAVRVVAGPL